MSYTFLKLVTLVALRLSIRKFARQVFDGCILGELAAHAICGGDLGSWGYTNISNPVLSTRQQ